MQFTFLRFVYLSALVVSAALGPVNLACAAEADAPQFTAAGELIRPEGYREWIFAGASLGMSYDEESEAPKHPQFHNVYIQPAAYQQYKSSGRFPPGTILILELMTATSQASINRQGHFEDRLVGIEAAVKDPSRFPEGWAYFSFRVPGGPPAKTAKAFPKQRCWSCHDEHAATDNVFTQFYPLLRRRQ